MIVWWTLIPVGLVGVAIGLAVSALVRAGRAQRAVDRRLAWELRRPRINDSELADRAERQGRDG